MPSPGRSMRHSKFSNLKFSPCSRLVIPRGLNLPTKSQARRAQNAQSHHVVAMERVLCECGDELLCARMQKGCPDSWWYTINRRNGNWREEILKNLFNFDAPRAHLGIIRSSRLGTREIFFLASPSKGESMPSEETRSARCLMRVRLIDWNVYDKIRSWLLSLSIKQ